MAQQNINLGAPGTGAGGDSARTAFEKTELNFTELYESALTAAEKEKIGQLGPWATAETPDAALSELQFTALGKVLAKLQNPQAGRAALELKNAALADMLGNVSQTGGTPTGDIFQKGNNANGAFVRFADGTQICWHALTMPPITSPTGALYAATSEITWTYPIAFAGVPCVISNDESWNIWVVSGALSAANVQLRSFFVDQLSGSRTVRSTAIGRWF